MHESRCTSRFSIGTEALPAEAPPTSSFRASQALSLGRKGTFWGEPDTVQLLSIGLKAVWGYLLAPAWGDVCEFAGPGVTNVGRTAGTRRRPGRRGDQR